MSDELRARPSVYSRDLVAMQATLARGPLYREDAPALWRTLAYLALARPVRAAVELLRGRPRLAWAGLRGTIDGFFPETRA